MRVITIYMVIATGSFYKMDGVDPDWVDAGNRREVFYSNLASGNYLLRIKVLNNDGTIGPETHLKIEVLPLYGRVGGHLLFMLLLFSTYCNVILPISKGNNG